MDLAKLHAYLEETKPGYVRSQDLLALDKPEATGSKLSFMEAFESYGLNVLGEVFDYGSAVIVKSKNEPAATIRSRRDSLGLTEEALAKATKLPASQIRASEDCTQRTPIKKLESIAMHLGLDERYIAVESGARGDEVLAGRLRAYGTDLPHFSQRLVADFAYAAWVIQAQIRLQKALSYDDFLLRSFQKNSNYGEFGYHAYEQGYFLAQQARKMLGYDDLEPIEDLENICNRLSIPLLKGDLTGTIAGATISSGGGRGIVINSSPYNGRDSSFVQRATIAHELGHLLWDPDEELRSIRVDNYNELVSLNKPGRDRVEARANAFAISFLAPPKGVVAIVKDSSNSNNIISQITEKYGIGNAAARHHAQNIANYVESNRSSSQDPSVEWMAAEEAKNFYYPIEIPQILRGDFARIVIEANRANVISDDTAAGYLSVSVSDYIDKRAAVEKIYY